MSLSAKDSTRLRRAGFLNYEIQYFGGAVAPDDAYQPKVDLNSATWINAMSQRRKWWQDKMAKGFNVPDIKNTLINYYRKRGARKRTPYDFIRAEYKPPGKLKDYLHAIRRRAKDRMARGLGGVYKRGAGRHKRRK